MATMYEQYVAARRDERAQARLDTQAMAQRGAEQRLAGNPNPVRTHEQRTGRSS